MFFPWWKPPREQSWEWRGNRPKVRENLAVVCPIWPLTLVENDREHDPPHDCFRKQLNQFLDYPLAVLTAREPISDYDHFSPRVTNNLPHHLAGRSHVGAFNFGPAPDNLGFCRRLTL